jgi:uncharacterized membrane protein YfcA
MTVTTAVLLGALLALGICYAVRWFLIERSRPRRGRAVPDAAHLGIGFGTNFLDTLGIGSFAPTTALFKLLRVVPDERIPGTLNVGQCLPTLTQGLIFIAAVAVDPVTLVSMIAAAVLGARWGAGVVARLPRRAIQIGMGAALLVAAVLFVLSNLQLIPGGGDATHLGGARLICAVAVNFLLGALMTLGVGLYAPCLILVSLLGMSPIAAFPIMMGSCAFLMPVAGLKFVASDRYDLRAALGLALGGLPAVFLAAFVVKQLPLYWLRWLVVAVVLYTAVVMLRSGSKDREEVLQD